MQLPPRMQGEIEVCNECGQSVRPGSGKFVNRIPDANTFAERVEMGKPYPAGEWMCAECEDEFYRHAIDEGECCPECQSLNFYDGKCPDCGHYSGILCPR